LLTIWRGLGLGFCGFFYKLVDPVFEEEGIKVQLLAFSLANLIASFDSQSVIR